MNNRELVQISLLAAFISVTGAIKIPSFFPGADFQLSAPLAVAICYAFGAKIYLSAGILSSAVGLMLGTQTLFHVFIAMVFRVGVALIMLAFGRNKLTAVLAGPLASAVARLSLGFFIGKSAYVLVLAALPGMLYTALFSLPLGMLLERIKRELGRVSNVV